LLTGTLPPRDFALVAKWIDGNKAALIGYRDGTLSTVEFVKRMHPLSGADRQ
jgi:hypothetical protein